MIHLETLLGRVKGASRAEMLKEAEHIAEQYFGLACTRVRFGDVEVAFESVTSYSEKLRSDPTFIASFTAEVQHLWDRRYAPVRCARCGLLEEDWLAGND